MLSTRDPAAAKPRPFQQRLTHGAASVTTNATRFYPQGSETSVQFISDAAGRHPGSNRTHTGSYVDKPPDQVARLFHQSLRNDQTSPDGAKSIDYVEGVGFIARSPSKLT